MARKLPDMSDRQVLQCLLSGDWKLLRKLRVNAGPDRLRRLTQMRWIELREHDGKLQIRITPLGLEMFKAKLPEGYLTRHVRRR